MALTIQSETTKVTSLEDYKAFVKEHVDVRDLDSVYASADQLKALANNKTFLIEYLNQELLDWRQCQLTNSYTAQTQVLGGGPDFLIRANIWMPPAQTAAAGEDEKHLFLYQIPHDHNFSFLTVGYFGPGYETTIYQYDPLLVQGELGERVDLQFLETTTLPTGKIMLYRASRDVHSQGHPESFSISLNLLLAPPEINRTDQYLFDLASSKITQHTKSPASSRLMMCRVAGYIGDSRTSVLLEALACRHHSPRVRLTATESLVALEPGERDTLWRKAVDDPSPVLRKHARRELNH